MRQNKIMMELQSIEVQVANLEQRRAVLQHELNQWVDWYMNGDIPEPINQSKLKREIDKITDKIMKLREKYFKLQSSL